MEVSATNKSNMVALVTSLSSTAVSMNGKHAARHGDTARTGNGPFNPSIRTVVVTGTVMMGG